MSADLLFGGADLQMVYELQDEIERLRALLAEARESWIKVGYGASHEDVAECRDFCERIDAALGRGEG